MSGLGYLPTTILNVAEAFTNLTKCTLVNTLYIRVTLALNNLLIVGLLSSPTVIMVQRVTLGRNTGPSTWPSRATHTCKKKQFSKGRVFSYFVGMDKLFYFFQVPLHSLHHHSKNKGYMFWFHYPVYNCFPIGYDWQK